MRHHPDADDNPHPDVWTGRATNRVQWLLALAGAACMALGIQLAVDSAWSSGIAPLVMSVVGCIAAGLLVLFGTLAFVHVDLKLDKECVEVRCGHIGLPRRRIPLSHVAGADFTALVTPATGAAGATAGVPRRAPRSSYAAARASCCACGTVTRSPSRWTTPRRRCGPSGTACARSAPARRAERTGRLITDPR